MFMMKLLTDLCRECSDMLTPTIYNTDDGIVVALSAGTEVYALIEFSE